MVEMRSSDSDNMMTMALIFNIQLVLLDSNMEMKMILLLHQLKNNKFL